MYDLERSRFAYRHNAGLALEPASNAKLPVAVTALSVLGPGFRFTTKLHAEGSLKAGGVWKGRLVLEGLGDPSLSGAKLGKLAHDVARAGITKVTGALVADETYFDKVRVGPGWKSSFYKLECPPLSALIANRGYYRGHVTSKPALAAAKLLRAKLEGRGVDVRGRIKRGRADPDPDLVWSVRSGALKWLVRRMNRQSDNFYAEMLVKELGARAGRGGTTADGVRIVRKELRHRGVSLDGVVLADGSGLSAYDRLTARAATLLLISAMSDARIGSPFVGSLPLAGVNGTLVDRMESPPAYRHVRAKTGTTDSASALSGYAGSRFVFSILMNGSPIAWLSARRAQDRFAQVLAGR